MSLYTYYISNKQKAGKYPVILDMWTGPTYLTDGKID